MVACERKGERNSSKNKKRERQRDMNCETCQLKELELDPAEIRDVLRCVLHTIFFHRALGLVRPKDVDCELFEITYVQCGDAELEKKIDEKIEQFVAWSEKHPNRKSQVCLSFYEVKSKQSSWFGSKVERQFWENWIVNVNVHPINPPKSSFLNTREKVLEETRTRMSALETSVREILFQIIKFANEKQEHIPPITNSEVVSFPYEITTPR
ncbi:hypothetical protein LUZ61_002356 [Rhynchospora tenuis]|uniref:Autophagy-related protein 101 n=1 Tax=Rhynchospora tenuis TaxID=198213 RepID=A0AAD6ERR3_9POAL|nr:hypothetical protein LUZ61_002356 [Rhynchospora tenuis]